MHAVGVHIVSGFPVVKILAVLWVGNPSDDEQEGYWESSGSQESFCLNIYEDARCWQLITLERRSAGLSDVGQHLQSLTVVRSLIHERDLQKMTLVPLHCKVTAGQ